ncbi:DUF5631 domain-containing protein [Mycolicibacter minnesotensis]
MSIPIASDLPEGPWSPWLVGLWWPAAPAQPEHGINFWSGHAELKGQEIAELNRLLAFLAMNNSGHTADDMIGKLRTGMKQLTNIQRDCLAKSTANARIVAAIYDLRENLEIICQKGNEEIDAILQRPGNTLSKLPDIQKVITSSNSQANSASENASNSIIDETRRLFDSMEVLEDPRNRLQDHGANFGIPVAPPITADEVDRTPFKGNGADGGSGAPTGPIPATDGSQLGTADGKTAIDGGAGADSPNGSTPPSQTAGDGGAGRADAANTSTGLGGPGVGTTASKPSASTGNGPVNATTSKTDQSPPTPTSSTGNGPVNATTSKTDQSPPTGGPNGDGAKGVNAASAASGGESVGASDMRPANRQPTESAVVATDGHPNPRAPAIPHHAMTDSAGPTPEAQPPAPTGGSGTPLATTGGGGGGAAPSLPGLGGAGGSGGLPPGLQGGGLSQPLASGSPGGPFESAGALSGPSSPLRGAGEMSGLASSSGPQVPPSPSVTPMSGGLLGNLSQLASPGPEAAPPMPATNAPPVTPPPAPMAAGPASVPAAPMSSGPAASAGPLPSYGSDLRPTGAAAPSTPAVPAGPSSPAPPPSSPTTPASAGTTVASTGDRSAPARPIPGTGGLAGATMAGGMAASGTAGAAIGTAGKRMAEQQAVQRTLDAVARQAPHLAWAAGLRDDETTTVLATDLAGGWIPPIVKLPPGVTLLDPADRRHDTSALDLLGPVVVAAAHQPDTYITEPGPHDPLIGAGERARYGHHVDELGPTLIDAAAANSRLPRIVQTVALAVARRSGLADNEFDLFQQVVTDTQARVLSAYPQHVPRDVADWMLLTAIDALIEGTEETARYHLAWYLTVAVRHGGVKP